VQASAVLRRHRARLRSVSQLRGDRRRGAFRVGPSAGRRGAFRRSRLADRRGADPAPPPLATTRRPRRRRQLRLLGDVRKRKMILLQRR